MTGRGGAGGSRAEAVLSIFKRGADFMKQLMDENETLRKQLSQVRSRQQTAARDPGDWEDLRRELLSRIHDLEDENQNILEQLRSVESENQQFAERYVEIEEENNNLANLYVASYQLHSTMDPNEVIKVILEIVINLIGGEIFCVYVHEEKAGILNPVAAEGKAAQEFPTVRLGEGAVGECVANGRVLCDGEPGGEGDESDVPVLCIPLRVEDRPVGAIVIESLLAQKDGFSALDQELFALLAGHAATAILASRLYAESERKRTTIQGFIDLLTK